MSGPGAARVGVLALQGDVTEHALALERVGATVVPVRVPGDLEGVDGLVLPGGESTTLTMLLESSGLRRVLEARLAEGMPSFGTCAGMILLAREVLDGRADQRPLGAIDVAVRRNAFGRQLDSFETELDVAGLAEPVPAVFIRAPAIERVGADVEVLASIERGGRRRIVLARSGPVLVAAFHPELTGDTRLHRSFLETVDAARGARYSCVRN